MCEHLTPFENSCCTVITACVYIVHVLFIILLQIWDFPGQIDFFDPAFDSEHIFGGCGALIFVIDAQVSHARLIALPPSSYCGLFGCFQDDYREALIRLHQTVTRAYMVNQNIKFEVFIHKVDGLSDDRKIGAFYTF